MHFQTGMYLGSSAKFRFHHHIRFTESVLHVPFFPYTGFAHIFPVGKYAGRGGFHGILGAHYKRILFNLNGNISQRFFQCLGRCGGYCGNFFSGKPDGTGRMNVR